MHIALITPSFPARPDSTSQVRVSKLARALARHGTVQLFSAITDRDQEAEAWRAGRGLEPYSRVVTHRLQHASAAARAEGPEECRRFPDALVRALGAANEVHPFDVVVITSVLAARAQRAVERSAVVLDVPRIEWVARERRVRRGSRKIPWGLLEMYRWRRYERELWMRVDALTAARVGDLPLIHAERPDTGVHIPNGVDTAAYAFKPPSQRRGNTVLFAGPLWYEPNVLSATILCTEVMPQVRAVLGDATLTIAGRSPGARIRALESDHVRVTGELTSMMALYSDHAVMAVPSPPGRSPEARLLNAFASGIPVVTSTESLPDPAAVPNKHFVAAQSPADFATQIVRLLRDRASFDSLAMLASRLAARYDWEQVGESFARVVLAAAERRRV